MANLNKTDLEKVITELFKFMEKRGITLSSEDKKNITEQLTEALDDQLSRDDANDPTVQKKLLSCISAKLMGDDKTFTNMLKVLQSNEKDTPDKTLNLNLKAMFALLVAASKIHDALKDEKNKHDPDQSAVATMLALLKPKSNKEPVKDPEDELTKLLDATLRNLYGGENPTMDGEITFPVLGPIIGNAFGFTNQCAANPNSCAEMVELITYNAGKLDPLGLENIAKLADIEDGIDIPTFNSSTPRPMPHGIPR